MASRLLAVLAVLCTADVCSAARSFVINGTSFLRDGVPFQLISGSMHYFRHHPSTFEQRLGMARLCGLNAVQTYVSWTIHEPAPGRYQRLSEITAFLSAAQAAGLLVILRPGPYICAETEGGGLPGWLQAQAPAPYGIVPRSGDPRFLAAVDSWFAVLLPLLEPFLYANGGPVVLAQVSNEDGYWSGAPGPYLSHVRDAFVAAWGVGAVIIHSTDGVNASLLASTSLPGQFQTVDFGPGPAGSAEAAFAVQAAANGGAGPAMNSEYYVGGVNRNWGDPPYANDTDAVIAASTAFLRGMLTGGASVNMYVFSGGTNWGFEAGLHADGPAMFQTGPYIPGGPLTEAGDASPYFGPVCAAVSESQGVQPPVPPPPAPKSHYMSELVMTEYATLWDALPLLLQQLDTPAGPGGFGSGSWQVWPPTLESLGFDRGYVLYTSAPTAEAVASDLSNLYVRDVRDRAYVFVNATAAAPGGRVSRAAVLQRNLSDAWAPSEPVPVTVPSPRDAAPDNTLLVLVENEGRACFGPHLGADAKGLPGGLQLGTWANPYVFNWSAAPLPMANVTGALLGPALRPVPPAGFNASWDTPTFYRASFSLAGFGAPLRDSFLDMRGWGKGFVVVNGFNLGRFWYLGPEFSLYVPAGVLLPGDNELIVFEADGVGAGCGAGARGEPPAAGEALSAGALAALAPVLNGVSGGGAQARLEARATGGARLQRPPPARHAGGCPAVLPTTRRGSGGGAPYVTFREVPVRDLP